MFAGHFALAAGVKANEPTLPLWALMLGTQLLDVCFVPLYLTGVETLEPVPGAAAYGGAVIHADYTHSLVGALAISAVAGLLARRSWGQRAGWVLAGVVFSHWLLDLVVHRPDLPILPGNLGDLPLLGFGLWARPALSASVEGAMVLAGALLYHRAAKALPLPAGADAADAQRRRLVSSGVLAALLVASLVTSVLGIE